MAVAVLLALTTSLSLSTTWSGVDSAVTVRTTPNNWNWVNRWDRKDWVWASVDSIVILNLVLTNRCILSWHLSNWLWNNLNILILLTSWRVLAWQASDRKLVVGNWWGDSGWGSGDGDADSGLSDSDRLGAGTDCLCWSRCWCWGDDLCWCSCGGGDLWWRDWSWGAVIGALLHWVWDRNRSRCGWLRLHNNWGGTWCSTWDTNRSRRRLWRSNWCGSSGGSWWSWSRGWWRSRFWFRNRGADAERNVLAIRSAGASLVERDGTGTTAVLGLVASALHEAVAHESIDWGGGSWDAVTTVALVGVLGAGDGEAAGLAELDADLVGHVWGGGAGAGQGAATDIVLAAANVLEALGGGEIDEWVLWCGEGGWCTAAGGHWLVWTLAGGWVAAWEAWEGAKDFLVNGGWDLAVAGEVILEEVENTTVFNVTTVGGTLGDGTLKDVLIPAVDKVTVVSVTSLITVGENKWLLVTVPLVAELIGVPCDFIEERDEALWVRWWAASRIDTVWVGHVRLVIWRVEVDTVPARWEEDLSAKTVWAVDVWQLVGLWSRNSEAGVVDGALLESVGEGAEAWGAGEHTESWWESQEALLKLWVILVGALKIVDKTTTDLLDRSKLSILALIVESWNPVVAEIGLDSARRAGRSASLIEIHIKTKAVTTHDGVDVTGDGTWVDDWVGALSDENTWAWKTEEGVNRREDCRKGEDRDVHEAHLCYWGLS